MRYTLLLVLLALMVSISFVRMDDTTTTESTEGGDDDTTQTSHLPGRDQPVAARTPKKPSERTDEEKAEIRAQIDALQEKIQARREKKNDPEKVAARAAIKARAAERRAEMTPEKLAKIQAQSQAQAEKLPEVLAAQQERIDARLNHNSRGVNDGGRNLRQGSKSGNQNSTIDLDQILKTRGIQQPYFGHGPQVFNSTSNEASEGGN